jgi:hypothetical protein
LRCRTTVRVVASYTTRGFLAHFEWWPNRVALEWLLRDVLPRVVRRDLRLDLFGAGSTRFVNADSRIVAQGFVEDVARVFATSDVMLCPTHTGAGVNVKFAEALCNRVPVLGTRVAARGLPPADGARIPSAAKSAAAARHSGKVVLRVRDRQSASAWHGACSEDRAGGAYAPLPRTS